MSAEEIKRDLTIPENWDRKGLPSWAYHNEYLLKIEEEELFHKHWQLICHQSDISNVGDFITFDVCKERVLIVRDKEKKILARSSDTAPRTQKFQKKRRRSETV